jgi:hypothetical protein
VSSVGRARASGDNVRRTCIGVVEHVAIGCGVETIIRIEGSAIAEYVELSERAYIRRYLDYRVLIRRAGT